MSPHTPEQKAAILLVALGEDLAGIILKNLPDRARRKAIMAISKLGQVPDQLAVEVLEEFQTSIQNQENTITGGTEKLKDILKKSGQLSSDLSDQFAKASARLSALDGVEIDTIMRLIQDEHPQTVATTLALIDTPRAAQLMSKLSHEMATEVMLRIAQLNTISSEAIEVLNTSFEMQIRKDLNTYSVKRGGKEVVASLLSSLSKDEAEHLLSGLAKKDQQLSQSIADQMLQFEDLASIPEAAWPTLVAEIPRREWLHALKGETQVKETYLKYLSKRNAELFEEDLVSGAKIKLSEVHAAQKSIVNSAWKLHKEGKIPWSGEKYV